VSQNEIEEVASPFYKDLFMAYEELSPNLILHHVPRKVLDDMNDRLARTFTAEEVERAIFAMGRVRRLVPTVLLQGSTSYIGSCWGRVSLMVS
jgi:hypothetical protein